MSDEKLKRVLEVKWWSGGHGTVGAVAITYQKGWRAYIGCCNSLRESTENDDTVRILEYGTYLNQDIARSIFSTAELSIKPYIEKRH